MAYNTAEAFRGWRLKSPNIKSTNPHTQLTPQDEIYYCLWPHCKASHVHSKQTHQKLPTVKKIPTYLLHQEPGHLWYQQVTSQKPQYTFPSPFNPVAPLKVHGVLWHEGNWSLCVPGHKGQRNTSVIRLLRGTQQNCHISGTPFHSWKHQLDHLQQWTLHHFHFQWSKVQENRALHGVVPPNPHTGDEAEQLQLSWGIQRATLLCLGIPRTAVERYFAGRKV